jgi:hypothetical protein
MSGPIVRTGTTPKFWQNWENVFGNKKSGSGAAKATSAKSHKSPKASAKKASTKTAAKKASKKK